MKVTRKRLDAAVRILSSNYVKNRPPKFMRNLRQLVRDAVLLARAVRGAK